MCSEHPLAHRQEPAHRWQREPTAEDLPDRDPEVLKRLHRWTLATALGLSLQAWDKARRISFFRLGLVDEVSRGLTKRPPGATYVISGCDGRS